MTASMKRHVIWHHAASELLRLPPAPPPTPRLRRTRGLLGTGDGLGRRGVRSITARDRLDAFNYRLHIPLNRGAAIDFAGQIKADAIAMMISSESHTPLRSGGPRSSAAWRP